jgi:TP901 family phage tail tape measure protein
MADSLTTVLGFEASEAIATLNTMQKSLASWTASMNSAAIAAKSFNTTAAKTENSLKGNASGMNKIIAAGRKFVDQYLKIGKRAEETGEKVEDSGEKIEQAGKRVLLSWQSVVRIFAIQVIHQAVTKITNAMWDGVAAARDFEIAVAEIQTIGVEFRDDFEGLAASVREFSDATGAPLESVTEGVYQTLSNQVTDAAHAFEFMASAQAFSIAAVTETSASVALLSSVMNSYNIEIDRSAEVGGKLAKIIELGRLRGEEFANTFGRVTVLASQLGISLDEVGASLATLTVSGLKYNEASTLMTNVMLKLIRPTEELQKRFDELGVAGAEAGIQAFGFQGFLDKLAEKSGSSATELGKLFNRVRAIRGVMGLANENAVKYIENLEGIRAAGADELFEKRDIIFETNAKQVEIEMNRLSNVMTVGFGRGLNTIIKGVFDTFGGGVETLQTLAVVATGAALAIVALKFATIKATTAMLVMAAANPFVLIAAGAATITAVLVTFYNRAQAESQKLAEAEMKQRDLVRQNAIKNMQLEIDAENARNDKIFAAMQRHLQRRKVAEDAASKNIVKLEDLVFTGLTDQLGNRVNAANAFFDTLENRAIAAKTVISDLNKTIQTVQFDISDFNFERETRGLDPVRKAFAGIERSAELRRKATRAARKGEFELADILNKRAKAAADVALSSADESDNRSLIQRAENAIRATMNTEIDILKTKKKLTEEEKSAIESQTEQINLQKIALKALQNEVKLTVKEFEEARFDPIKREELLTKVKELASEMQEIFDGIQITLDIAGIKGEGRQKLQTQADEIGKTFSNMITGQEGTLRGVVLNAVRTLNEEFKKATIPTTELDIEIAALTPGAVTTAEQQTALPQIQELTEVSRESSIQRVKDEQAYGDALDRNLLLLRLFKNAIADAPEAAFKGFADDTELAARRTERLNTITDTTRTAMELLNAEELDTTQFNAVKDSLALIAKSISDPEIATGIGVLINNLNELAAIKLRLGDTGTGLNPEELNQTDEQLRAIGELMGPGITAAADEGANGVAAAESAKRIEINRTTEAYKRQAIASSGGGGAVNQRFGGLIYRADGGWVPKGTDVVPAMLSPGEFVMNAAATRKFYSQLTSMNAGVNPQYRAQGGEVTNIGDVNINVNESTSPQQTAREVMSSFRRQTRRRSATL